MIKRLIKLIKWIVKMLINIIKWLIKFKLFIKLINLIWKLKVDCFDLVLVWDGIWRGWFGMV